MFEMTFFRRFEAAHRLIEGENGKSICAQPHGHSWNVTVSLSPKTEQKLDHRENTLVLFDRAKKSWHNWIDNHIDHSFIYNDQDPLLPFMLKQLPEGRHVVVPGDPTTEMVSVILKAKLESFLRDEDVPLDCVSVRIGETPTNGMLFTGNPADHLPKTEKLGEKWWQRSDTSTNDMV